MTQKNKKLTKQATLKQKLKDYKKILTDDEDWDWTYILRLLRYKLERTRKCISANGIIKEAPQVARQIRQVEVLLDRVEKDRYFWQISKDFHKRYGRLKMVSGKSVPGRNYTTAILKFTKETTQNSKKIHRQHRRLWEKAHKMQQDDLKTAFELMHKNIWGWWD